MWNVTPVLLGGLGIGILYSRKLIRILTSRCETEYADAQVHTALFGDHLQE